MDLDTAINTLAPQAAAYVLRGTADNYLYKGSCRNLVERLKDHRAGRVSHTKNKRPLDLLLHEYHADFTQARQRENFWKSGAGRAELKSRFSVPADAMDFPP